MYHVPHEHFCTFSPTFGSMTKVMWPRWDHDLVINTCSSSFWCVQIWTFWWFTISERLLQHGFISAVFTIVCSPSLLSISSATSPVLMYYLWCLRPFYSIQSPIAIDLALCWLYAPQTTHSSSLEQTYVPFETFGPSHYGSIMLVHL